MKSLLATSRTGRGQSDTVDIPWEEILTSFTDAVVLSDRDGTIIFFNPAAENLTGLPRTRVIGRPCDEVFAQTPSVAATVRRVEQQGQAETHGDEQLRCGRANIPVRLTCLPVPGDGDRVRGTVLAMHDMRPQKALEESARRSENLARLGTLVAGLAHEIRNPLAGIKGAAQLLAGRLADAEDLREYTTVIVREATRLSELVQDLLILGAPQKPHLAPVNIHRVLNEVLTLVEPELQAQGIRLRREFDPSLPDVAADDAQLRQLLLNLLKNAMEAMRAAVAAEPPRDLLTISTRMETDFRILEDRERKRQFLRVEFADQGVGIAAADAERVFEPFFTTRADGTGLGLAISNRIVAEHGGTLRVGPNTPVGTIVTVMLPVA